MNESMTDMSVEQPWLCLGLLKRRIIFLSAIYLFCKVFDTALTVTVTVTVFTCVAMTV